MIAKKLFQELFQEPPNMVLEPQQALKVTFLMRKPKTEKFKKCAAYLDPKKWNTLPAPIQSSENKVIWRTKLLELIAERNAKKASAGTELATANPTSTLFYV